jgi:predicted small lipoprotein YifL
MSRATFLLVSVIAALMLQGCGIKGPLQPPSEQPARKQQSAPAP